MTFLAHVLYQLAKDAFLYVPLAVAGMIGGIIMLQSYPRLRSLLVANFVFSVLNIMLGNYFTMGLVYLGKQS